jgi:hypothetical protein
MPLGISESLIQRAYAPVDLSGFYNELNNAIKKSEAILYNRSKLLEKEYYTEFNDLKKLNTGVLAADKNDIFNKIDEWKGYQSELSRNPSLKREQYNEIKKKADKANSEARALIEQSKNDASTFAELGKSYINGDQNDFIENFTEQYKKAKETPISQRSALGLNDPFRFMYREPNIKNIDSDIDKEIPKLTIDVFNQKGYSQIDKIQYGDEVKAIDPTKLAYRINTYVFDKVKSRDASAYMKNAEANGEIDKVNNEYQNLFSKSIEDYKNYKIGDKEAFILDPVSGGRLPSIPRPTGYTNADLAIHLIKKKLVENQPKVIKSNVERFSGSPSDIKEAREQRQRKERKEDSKEMARYRQSLVPKGAEIDDSALKPLGDIIKYAEKGDVKSTQEALNLLPNGYKNSYFVPGMYVAGNENGYLSMLKLMNIKTENLSELQIRTEIGNIKRMGVDELSKKLKIPKANLEKGLILTEGEREGKPVVESYTLDKSGKNKFVIFNRNAFGPKAEKGVLKSLSKEISGLSNKVEAGEFDEL